MYSNNFKLWWTQQQVVVNQFCMPLRCWACYMSAPHAMCAAYTFAWCNRKMHIIYLYFEVINRSLYEFATTNNLVKTPFRSCRNKAFRYYCGFVVIMYRVWVFLFRFSNSWSLNHKYTVIVSSTSDTVTIHGFSLTTLFGQCSQLRFTFESWRSVSNFAITP